MGSDSDKNILVYLLNPASHVSILMYLADTIVPVLGWNCSLNMRISVTHTWFVYYEELGSHAHGLRMTNRFFTWMRRVLKSCLWWMWSGGLLKPLCCRCSIWKPSWIKLCWLLDCGHVALRAQLSCALNVSVLCLDCNFIWWHSIISKGKRPFMAARRDLSTIKMLSYYIELLIALWCRQVVVLKKHYRSKWGGNKNSSQD